MWPLDRMLARSSAKEYLRVGRHSVERWKEMDGVLTLSASHALQRDATNPLQGLDVAIRALYSGKPGAQVTLLLESAWLPVMLADTGSALLRTTELDALVRHRFGLHYGDAREPVSAWELRIEKHAGRRHALAYGLTPRVKQVLLDAGRATGLTWAAMLPAFSWGWQRLLPTRLWPQATGWWIWAEQDRLLTMRVARNEFTGFNPGAPFDNDEAGILRLVDGEAARLGVASPSDPISVAVWDGPSHVRRPGARLTWMVVRGQPVQHVDLATGRPTPKAFT